MKYFIGFLETLKEVSFSRFDRGLFLAERVCIAGIIFVTSSVDWHISD